MFKDKEVLVTGGAGFLASNFILKLIDQGAIVTATYHQAAPQISGQPVSFIEADLTKYDDCLKVVSGKEIVVMCAGQTGGAEALESRQTSMAIESLVINAFTLKASFEAGVKSILLFSGSTVYPLSEEPWREGDSTFTFFGKYFAEGWSKRFSEILAEMMQRERPGDTKVTIVRPGNIYGPFDNFRVTSSHVIPSLITKALSRPAFLDVWGTGETLRDFIYVDDFVLGSLLALEKTPAFEPINIASGRIVSIGDLARMILSLTGNEDVEIKFNTTRPSMIPRQAFDVSKAQLTLGFEPKTSLEAGLTQTIDWRKAELLRGH